MSAPIAKKLTPDEYLALERVASSKSEYWHGQVFAMAGSTENHDLICSNLSRFIQNRLAGSPCRVFSSNMKVGATKKSGFAYPDLTVACGERHFYDDVRDVLTNPAVLFEVLSDSTRAFDQGEKFREYQRLDSVRHYVVVEQSRREVAHYERSDGNRWTYELLDAPEASLRLEALGIDLPLAEIYHEIEFVPVEQDPDQ